MKTLILITILLFSTQATFSQYFPQYFDGADTSETNSLIIYIQQDSLNIWQIGRPQKVLFDSAATLPNALVTDTINPYPAGNTSSFTIRPKTGFWTWGIYALQWKQKLDLDALHAYAKIEFSTDSGLSWQNTFDNPYVYNFYGYHPANIDMRSEGRVFTGTDTMWRDIWLCFDISWMNQVPADSLLFRFSIVTDSIGGGKEGWMIDNILSHMTMIHTVGKTEQQETLKVFPNPANNVMGIEMKKIQDIQLIEHMQLVNAMGQVVDEWHNIPTRFFIQTSKHPAGNYHLKVKTNIESLTVPVVIQR